MYLKISMILNDFNSTWMIWQKSLEPSLQDEPRMHPLKEYASTFSLHAVLIFWDETKVCSHEDFVEVQEPPIRCWIWQTSKDLSCNGKSRNTKSQNTLDLPSSTDNDHFQVACHVLARDEPPLFSEMKVNSLQRRFRKALLEKFRPQDEHDFWSNQRQHIFRYWL